MIFTFFNFYWLFIFGNNLFLFLYRFLLLYSINWLGLEWCYTTLLFLFNILFLLHLNFFLWLYFDFLFDIWNIMLNCSFLYFIVVGQCLGFNLATWLVNCWSSSRLCILMDDWCLMFKWNSLLKSSKILV